MESQVFYRKYRPQTLSEVVGQEHVTRTLTNALERGRVAHAYLFCGPRGTGKTSTGRIMAKAVNCQSNGRGEPCNACSLCRAITEGAALDVIEIDAASNRGIDEIRDLREKANYAPNSARRKVYIIDEVHMLTDAAANALLKTLEEPPPHVIFVLATTEPHRLPATVLSRCQRYDFRRLGQAAIVSRLAHICEAERLQVPPAALEVIARSATGSLRDAVNLLEQMVNCYGMHIELAQVQAALGITGDRRARELARHLVARDTTAGLQTLGSAVRDGLDLRQFHRELLEYLRQMLLVKCGSSNVVDATPEDIAEMQSAVAGADLEHVVETVKIVGRADLRLDSYSPLPLEIAVVECGLARRPAPGVVAPARPPARAGQQAPAPAQPTRPRVVAEASPGMAGPSATAAVVKEPAPSSDWEKVKQAVRAVNRNVATRLQDCEPQSLENGAAVLCFVHQFHKEKVEEDTYRKVVEDALSKVMGASYRVSCVLRPPEAKATPAGPPQGHLVKAALELGARITNTEEQHE
ncbi:MAG: DNA polymerase III subunit gamma/tau [Chloroflexi bacterium]|nr:DNA polymerase III subunit gamma/tau [Chloroflexota bacterium]